MISAFEKTSKHFFNSYHDDIMDNLEPYNKYIFNKTKGNYQMSGFTTNIFQNKLLKDKVSVSFIIITILTILSIIFSPSKTENSKITNEKVGITNTASTPTVIKSNVQLDDQKQLESITIKSKDEVEVIKNTSSNLNNVINQIIEDVRGISNLTKAVIVTDPAKVVIKKENDKEVNIKYLSPERKIIVPILPNTEETLVATNITEDKKLVDEVDEVVVDVKPDKSIKVEEEPKKEEVKEEKAEKVKEHNENKTNTKDTKDNSKEEIENKEKDYSKEKKVIEKISKVLDKEINNLPNL
ncbi:MAG: hypothetical protein [Bacteriophage sp.]|nr:MAG: hypothetical protein [Bacteriophage sp.]